MFDKIHNVREVFLFETHSILQVLLLALRIRRAHTIYFNRSEFTGKVSNRYCKVVEKIIRLINSEVEIRQIHPKNISQHIWLLNKECLNIVESFTSEIAKSGIYKMILDIMEDKNIIKYFKIN